LAPGETEILEKANDFVAHFEGAMEDDFNTADAISAIFELTTYVNTVTNEKTSKECLEKLIGIYVMLTDILGIIVDKEAENLEAEVEALINERQEARKAKDFARADEIRDELLAKGIVLEDTREGVKWKKA